MNIKNQSSDREIRRTTKVLAKAGQTEAVLNHL